MRQVILDTETTGLDPKTGHRIIEIGCVELIERHLSEHHFHSYLNPEREIDANAIKVHGITNEFIADKPLFKEIADSLFIFLKGAELIIHNASFDLGFLNHEFSLCQHRATPLETFCQITDSLVIAREKHPGQANSLDALCRRYQIDSSKRQFHGALLDAKLLADVYLAMTSGQMSMFGDNEAPLLSKTTVTGPIGISPLTKEPLVVIEANPSELQAHQAFMENIKRRRKNEA